MKRLQAKFTWGKKHETETGNNALEIYQQQEARRDHNPPDPPSCDETDLATLAPTFPDGIKILYDCRDATLDICFIHGLTGNRDKTWTVSGQSKPWPETLLPPKLNKTRILTYGYDAYILRESVATINGLTDHASNFLNDLSTERANFNASSRPLVVVAHSLGGLVCKEAILLSRSNPEPHLRDIFNCIKGIIFMGTPHKRSWIADWARIPASALGLVRSTNKSLLNVLETDNMYLQSVQSRFWSMIREQQKASRDVEVTCFFEELPLPRVGIVVSKDSATLEGYNAISIHANHSNMVKFSSVDDNGFKRLLGELIRWKSQAESSAIKQPKPSTEDAQNEKPSSSFFNNYGPGDQFNAPGGTQNINKGNGNQFPGATFSGKIDTEAATEVESYTTMARRKYGITGWVSLLCVRVAWPPPSDLHTYRHLSIGPDRMLSASVTLRASARRAVSRSSGAVAAATRSNITATHASSPSSKGLNTATATAVRAGSPSSRVSAAAPDRTREIVAQTIGNIGSRREGQQYLKLFASVSSQKFAVVKVGGQLLRDNLDELCQSFALLFELGLYPVIVHGAGPQLNQLLQDAGVEPQFEEGIRITDAKTLGIARKLFLKENQKLVMRLDELGVATRSLEGVFQADYLDKEKWQYVGKVTKVNTDPIKKSIDAGYIPILTSMAESEDGHLLNVNADVAASELARALEPLKIVYLSEKGGLFDGEGQMISQINLDQEFAGLMEKPWVRYGTRLKIKEINELLSSLPRTSSVAIIHPSDLQRELFTDSGAGTLIRRGAAIKRVTSISEFDDLDKLKENLIRDQEGLKDTIDQSIDYLKESPFTAYYDDTMQCLAVVIPPGPNRSIATLLTLAITKSGWLTNTAENIFAAIKTDYPSFVWTVSEHDENLTWFFEKADGSFNRNGSVLFYQSPDLSLSDVLPVYQDFISHGQADAERKV
ncbi:hypothetical protein FSARC_12051 [Fusarium sarcochroum]|uniref:acetylglutamate kinase n=1 Tax=Fusarium sarcochroum TaxID=1208366 RepID=A0A8H4TB55_9HYPO|nr:hypothetical protein FSARC_12051 [Fusarium sarcochroum]